MNKYYYKLNFSNPVPKDDVLTRSVRSMSRVQRDGKVTNSDIEIPVGTKYNIYRKSHLTDGSFEFSASFDMEDRIPYSADFHYDNEAAAREDGWDI